MRDLIYIVMQNPVLLLILLVWVGSGIASSIAKAKRAQQARPPRAKPEFEAYVERQREIQREQQQAAAQHAPAAEPQPAARNSEDIARQLREMLGLETIEAPPPRRVEREEPTPEPSRQESHWDGRDIEPGAVGKVGELHEVMAVKRHKKAAVAASVKKHRGHAPTKAGRPVRRPSGAVAVGFNPKAAAAAVVAMEVFGPPRAMRPYDPPHGSVLP